MVCSHTALLPQKERMADRFAGIRAILMHEALPQLRIRTGQIALKQRIERTDRLGHGQLQLRRIDVTAALSHILIMIITKQHDASSGA